MLSCILSFPSPFIISFCPSLVISATSLDAGSLYFVALYHFLNAFLHSFIAPTSFTSTSVAHSSFATLYPSFVATPFLF